MYSVHEKYIYTYTPFVQSLAIETLNRNSPSPLPPPPPLLLLSTTISVEEALLINSFV